MYVYTYIYIYMCVHIISYHIIQNGSDHCLPGLSFEAANSQEAQNRHRLSGYLAELVPGPPGKHAFKNFTVSTHRKTAG